MKKFNKTFLFFKQITLHKGIEIQLTLNDLANWFVISLQSHSKCDHAGVEFRIELLKLVYFHISFYDFRHWDYDKNDWYEYDQITFS
jgi:hypothetical protein